MIPFLRRYLPIVSYVAAVALGVYQLTEYSDRHEIVIGILLIIYGAGALFFKILDHYIES